MAKASHYRERNQNELRRKAPEKKALPRILIVCEGSKTELNYFEEIRQIIRLSTADIRIMPSADGTEPLQIVNFAIKEFNKRKKAYERVYAVFDRDQHLTYANAIHKSNTINLKNDERKPVVFEAIASVPCFEIWFLLHYDDIHAFLQSDEAFQKLKRHVPKYSKGGTGMYKLTQSMLETASRRAYELKARNCRLPGEEAYTDVHELVQLLKSIRLETE